MIIRNSECGIRNYLLKKIFLVFGVAFNEISENKQTAVTLGHGA